jgi:hypothetical protein
MSEKFIRTAFAAGVLAVALVSTGVWGPGWLQVCGVVAGVAWGALLCWPWSNENRQASKEPSFTKARTIKVVVWGTLYVVAVFVAFRIWDPSEYGFPYSSEVTQVFWYAFPTAVVVYAVSNVIYARLEGNKAS